MSFSMNVNQLSAADQMKYLQSNSRDSTTVWPTSNERFKDVFCQSKVRNEPLDQEENINLNTEDELNAKQPPTVIKN